MSNGDEPVDYEIGYGKPPKSRQFKKGVSGNPSGRPKKPSDSASELMKELQSKVTLLENGKRKAITRFRGINRQVVNKALSGNLQAARMVFDWIRQEMVAEQPQNSRNKPDRKPVDMTDEELLMVIQGIHPEYSTNKCPNCSRVRKVALVVDDEKLIATTLAVILNNAGFETHTLFSGQDAIDSIERLRPDLLITDVVMPGMTGIETAIITRSRLPKCKILLFSGHAATGDLLEAARSQGHEFQFLAKPVHPTDLLIQLRG
jgi:CheY-like chemotaxis protein